MANLCTPPTINSYQGVIPTSLSHHPLSSARCAPRHPCVLCFSGETHTIRGVFRAPEAVTALPLLGSGGRFRFPGCWVP